MPAPIIPVTKSGDVRKGDMIPPRSFIKNSVRSGASLRRCVFNDFNALNIFLSDGVFSSNDRITSYTYCSACLATSYRSEFSELSTEDFHPDPTSSEQVIVAWHKSFNLRCTFVIRVSLYPPVEPKYCSDSRRTFHPMRSGVLFFSM